jgi:hypothetical protein
LVNSLALAVSASKTMLPEIVMNRFLAFWSASTRCRLRPRILKLASFNTPSWRSVQT